MTTVKRILRNRFLLILGISESVSGVGNWVTTMAVLALIVFRGGGSVAQSSGVYLAGLLPTLLGSPLAGWLCDRLDRKWLMMGSQLLSGLVVTGLIFADRLGFIYGLLVVQAIFISIMTPARQAVVPDIVAREDLSRANAVLQQLAGVVKIGAPMLAGLILSVMNPHNAIILDVVSFALAAAILSRLPSLSPHGDYSTLVAEGAVKMPALPARTLRRVLRGDPRLRLLFALAYVGTMVITGFDALAPVFTRDVLEANETLFGLLIGLIGLGTVGVATILLLRRGDHSPWRDIVVGVVLLTCIPASLTVATWLEDATQAQILVATGCLLGGLGNGLISVQVGTLIQLLSPPEWLGRMAGVFQSTVVAGQLTGFLMTPLLVPSLLPIDAYFAGTVLALAFLVLCSVLVLRGSSGDSETLPEGDTQGTSHSKETT
jgi:MFS family permease